MKEIRFRAWAKDINGDWYMEKSPHHDAIMGRQPNCHIMQYTALSDKDGDEIYEGDILLIDHEIIADEIDGYKRMEPENLIEKVWWYKGKFVTEFDDLANTYEDAKVIGNIYENPDLLSTSQE